MSCQEELCPHLLFPRALISVHIRNDVEKANEYCWPSLHVLSLVLSLNHNGERTGQSLTRFSVSPRTSRDPWGLTQPVCLPADPDNWDSWPLCGPFQPPMGDKKGFGFVLVCIPPSYCSEKRKALSEKAGVTGCKRSSQERNAYRRCLSLSVDRRQMKTN